MGLKWSPGTYAIENQIIGDFPGGPVAMTTHSQSRDPRFPTLVRELDPTCRS